MFLQVDHILISLALSCEAQGLSIFENDKHHIRLSPMTSKSTPMVLRGGESRVLGSDGEKAVVFGGSRWLEMGNARWGFFPFR
ncbi:hypothetical protein V6N12_002827 [Hibiscus sabdariffa]|uniref:Secreted protein n=1 Tax=Hibiscus sabdariffa TaxID=183260 RepID=A0ABR2EA46_9ROSI